MIVRKTSKVLVTINDKRTWGREKSELFFLGSWCGQPDGLPLNATIVPFHWNDRGKFKEDYIYLQDFYEKLLKSLSRYLNKYHNINKSDRYWRIILGPWLLAYVGVMWDRWENIRVAFDSFEFDEINVIEYNFLENTPKDYSEASNLYNDSIWNNAIFFDIISKFHKSKIKVNTIKNNEALPIKHTSNPYTLNKIKNTVIEYIDSFLGIVFSTDKVIIVGSYFPNKSLLKILFKLRQVPRRHYEFYESIDIKDTKRHEIKSRLDLISENDFESFILNSVLMHIPRLYLEEFYSVRNRALSIKKNCKIIFTSNLHFNNEIFKVWCAEQIEKGTKFIISLHGGSIPLSKLIFNHEENEKFLTN